MAAAAFAQQPPAPSAAEPITDELAFATDSSTRMTVPVSIAGTGPYRFLVDTGAERTVISRELARRLSLNKGQEARVHSITEVADVGTVIIPSLQLSSKTVRDINAPALSQSDLGAEGMLGVDSLKSQRVLFDFKNQTMSISPSAGPDNVKWDGEAIVVRARSRFGRLILADARVDGEKVWVILDTGSEVTIGNEALRRRLLRRKKLGAAIPLEVKSVTGGTMTIDYARVKDLAVAGFKFSNFHIGFADVHPFRKLDLLDRPALLLGMDALSSFDRISVDFASRRVHFDMPDTSSLRPETRLAAR